MTLFRCAACDRISIDDPGYCRCGGQSFHPLQASGAGSVYSCTTLYAAAERFEKDLPFQIAIIELEEGPRLTARICGQAVHIGDAVKLAEERDGVCFFEPARP